MLEANSRDSRLAFTYGLAFVFIFSTLRLSPGHGSNGNVEQWINLTNEIFLGSQDLLFSYGPMYWLVGGVATPYNEGTYWTSVVFISAINALFWALTVSLVRPARSYVFLALAFFFFFNAAVFSPSLFLWPFMTMAYFDRDRCSPGTVKAWIWIVLGAAVALSFYVRFFYGLVALVTIGAYLFSWFLSERQVWRALQFLLSLLITYVLLGLLIFQDKANALNYLVINKELSYGNSVDMALDVRNSSSSFVAAAIAAGALNLYLVLYRRRLLLTANVLLLIFFKLGFSRSDHYVAYFVVPTAVLALITIFEAKKYGRIIFLAIMGSLYYLACYPSYPGAPQKNALLPPVDFKIDYESRMAKTYPRFELSRDLLEVIGQSSVDVYPYQNEYAYANKLNYRHRPSFQNYMTLTPKLDAMNQAFYESSAAPDFVLWTAGINCRTSDCNPFDSFDGKYALNEDPLTSTAILNNYHIVATGKGRDATPLMILAKDAHPKAYPEQYLGEARFQFGKWYKVPRVDAGLVKLKPDFRLTLYGKMKNLFFRGDILKVKYRLVSGEIKEYRLNILNARSGVLASPLLDDINLSGPRVEYVMFETESSRYFDPTFIVSWVTLPIAAIRERTVASLYDSVTVAPKHSVETVMDCEGSVDAINGAPAGRPPSDTSVYLDVHGWLAASARNGTLFDETFVVLNEENGNRRFASTRPAPRDDVAVAYQHTELRAAGFRSLIDSAGFSGKVQLGLGGKKGSTLYVCRQFAIPITIVK
jgi:hypothetical protein